MPPLPVQERIINAFSSWESSIEIANATVAAKKKFKAAVMHQLLSGRIRFPGFGSPIKKAGLLPEGWVETSLEEISSITFSGVDKKCREGQRPIRLCNYLDVYKNDYITQNLSFMEATASEAEIAKLELKSGDVIITKDSETPDDIGIPGVVIEDLPGVVCGYHLALIRPDMTKVEPIFLATQFHSHSAKKQFNAVANGAIRFGLSTTAIRGFRFFLPPLPEQRRIAHLVRSFDREITLLNRTVKLLQTQKEGMMLKLLTAKIRVKV